NDPGMNRLYMAIMEVLKHKTNGALDSQFHVSMEKSEKSFVIPPNRTRYLSEISENNRNYDSKVEQQVEVAQNLYGIFRSLLSLINLSKSSDEVALLTDSGLNEALILESLQKQSDQPLTKLLLEQFNRIKKDLDPHHWDFLLQWEEKKSK